MKLFRTISCAVAAFLLLGACGDESLYSGEIKVQTLKIIPLADTGTIHVYVDTVRLLSVRCYPKGAVDDSLSWSWRNTKNETADDSIAFFTTENVVNKNNLKDSVYLQIRQEDTIIVTVRGSQSMAKVSYEKAIIAIQHIEELSLNVEEAVLGKNDTLLLSPIYSPQNIKTPSVRWASNNRTVAMVNDSGLVTTADSLGSAVITVKVGDKEAKCTLQVK